MRIIHDRARALDLDDFLDRPLFAFLGTVSETGDPRVSPVWFLWEASAIWIIGNTQEDSFPGRVRADQRCALAIEDFDHVTGKVHHVGMRGAATVEDFDVDRAKRLLARYLGPDPDRWDQQRFVESLDGPNNALVRLVPETVVVRDVSYRPVFDTGTN